MSILNYHFLIPNCQLILITQHYNQKLHNRVIEMSQGNKNSFQTLPIRAYLDDTVIPLVLKALSALAQERVKPQNPVQYIADYLLKHNPEDKQALQAHPA